MKKIVAHLYRNPGRYFSIERVFRQLEPELNKFVTVNKWTAPRSGASPGKIIRNIFAARSCKADVYHITGDIHYLALGLPPRRSILTIHDCVFLYQSAGLKRRLLKWLFLDLPVKHCRLITTISESTRKDILSFTGCSPEKVIVIPDPVNDMIRYEPRIFSRQEPMILFIGTTPNKNLDRAIQALQGIPCSLEIIGKLRPGTEALLKRSDVKYSSQVNLTDEEVGQKYIDADIVLFPSTFEGFGLPIVEGQKAGRAIITSNMDPMKEVAGGAACLVNPFSVASIREGIVKVIDDKAYREKLISMGFQNVKRFNTGSIAQQYLSCYQKVWSDNPY